MNLPFEQKYKKYLEFFNNNLTSILNSLDNCAPKSILEGMKYAVADGGKRVRPILCLATAEMLGLNLLEVANYSVAIEFIHSYSLVHDDLPAMDNDDFRRGKLSTHKKFGEANGILIGDALLNFAFELCLNSGFNNKNHIDAMKVIAEFAGYNGMIAGQVLDLENEKNSNPSEEILYSIYKNKTGKLLTAPLLVASCVANCKYYNQLEQFGYNLGALFQITDDLMDEEGSLAMIGKTPHKDKEADKLTSIKIFGLNGAKCRAKMHYEKCIEILKNIPNSEFLLEFTNKMYARKN